MRLVDFLIHLLRTQAETLQRLAAFFGEEELLQLLEDAGEKAENRPITFQLNPQAFEIQSSDSSSCYAELEATVREVKLVSFLEFHLWAYPFYRTLIESSVDLNSRFRKSAPEAIDKLVNEALSQSKTWMKDLPIPPAISQAAESAALVPWLRFRAQVLTQAGKRPISAI